jgi:hypothetical protein
MACYTIDKSAGPFLQSCRDCPQFAGHMCHQSTKQAIDNISSRCDPGMPAWIIGHGAPGRICTNYDRCPDYPFEKGPCIDARNEESLKPLANRVLALYFGGCQVGADEEGRNFLQRVAEIINAPALGPLSDVTCDVAFHTGPDDWGIAYPPDHNGNPRPPLAEGFLYPDLSTDRLHSLALLETGAKTWPTTATFFRQSHDGSRKKLVALSKADDVKDLIRFVDFGHPLSRRGVSGTTVNGALLLTFDDGTVHEFLVRDDLLLQDRSQPAVYYACKRSDFSKTLAALAASEKAGRGKEKPG